MLCKIESHLEDIRGQTRHVKNTLEHLHEKVEKINDRGSKKQTKDGFSQKDYVYKDWYFGLWTGLFLGVVCCLVGCSLGDVLRS